MKTIAKKLFNIKDLDRREWLKCRQEGIGGSDVAAILGLNKYKSALNVYIDKVEELPEVEEERSEKSKERLYWGNKLESTIAFEFKRRNPEFTKVQKSSYMWHHPEHKFMVANVDRILYHPEDGWGVLEIKTASENRSKEFDGSVPEEYLLQAMHYLAVMGFDYAYFAVLVGFEYRQFKVARDEELIEALIELEKDFWVNRVLAGDPPDVDGSLASTELIKKMYIDNAEIRDKSEVIELSESDEELIRQYEEGRAMEKEGKALKDEAGNKLKKKIGDFQVSYVNGRKVSWTAFEKSYFNKTALIQEHPELADKYVEKKVERKFTIGKAKISG